MTDRIVVGILDMAIAGWAASDRVDATSSLNLAGRVRLE